MALCITMPRISFSHLSLAALIFSFSIVGASFAAVQPAKKPQQFQGRFNVPPKEYRLGDIVKGAFTLVNGTGRAIKVTVSYKRWTGDKWINEKKIAQMTKGGTAQFPLEWKLERQGGNDIQYKIYGQLGKTGIDRTFAYTVKVPYDIKIREAPRSSARTVPPLLTRPLTFITACQSNDYDCLIRAAQTCVPSTMAQKQTVDLLLGVKQTTTGHLKFEGMKAGICIFSIKNLKSEFVFPPGTPQEATRAIIEAYKKIEGRHVTCEASTAFFVNLLSKWKQGNVSSDDLKGAKCSENTQR